MNKLIMCYPAHHQRMLGKKGLYGPLAFAYIARHTPDYYRIKLYDEYVGERLNPDTIDADLVAISAVTPAISRAYEIGDKLKKRNIPCVIGGPHVSVLTYEALDHFDSVIIGEGESPWKQFLYDFEKGKTEKTYSGPMDVSLENLLIPRREFINPNYHLSTINTSRGCPHNCSFCYLSIFENRKYRAIPHDFILQDLESIKNKKMLAITDENFMGFSEKDIEDRKILMEKMIKKRFNFSWGCQTTVRLSDQPELMSLMHRAGCSAVFIGFESAGQEGLKEVNKKHNLDLNYAESVRKIHKHKIAVIASYVIGLDSQKYEYAETLVREIKEIKPDALLLPFMTAWPGTSLFKRLQREGRIEKNWDKMDFELPYIKFKHFTREEIIDLRNRTYKSFYNFKSIISIVLRNLYRTRITLILFLINLLIRWRPRWLSKSSVQNINI